MTGSEQNRSEGEWLTGGRVSSEWELAADRMLDGLDDKQLVHLSSAIDVTLDERGWIRPDGRWRSPEDDTRS